MLAWSYKDMLWIDLKVACHKLAINKEMKLVK